MSISKKIIAAAITSAMLFTTSIASSASTVSDMGEEYQEQMLNVSNPDAPNSTVTYDRYSEINPYTQITAYGCATTCAGMCVKKSPADLRNAGFNLDYANWYGIGSTYGYSVDWLGRADINGTSDGLQKIYNYLRAGYPVCVWINTTESGTHWVVVYKYSGNGTSFSASDFMCIDPARCWTTTTRNRPLDQAFNYDGVYNTVVFM